ncbi:alpha/beta hydrolase, partial [Salinispira pacifica]
KYGPLTMVERPPAAGNVEEALTVVLAHGFGANAWDLAPVAETVDRDREFRWLFPHAPVSLAAAAGQPGIADDDYRPEIGRAWFPRTTEELRAVLYGDYFATIAEQSPPTLRSAGTELLVAVAEACGGRGLSRVVLGGFSQGAMVSVEALLQAEETPAALLILSGNPIDEGRWQELFRSYPERHEKPQVPYFQTHGTGDPILSYSEARRLNEMMTRAGLVGEFHHFPGGHWIPDQILWSLSEFLLGI